MQGGTVNSAIQRKSLEGSGLWDCRECGVHRPHYLVRFTAKWTHDPLLPCRRIAEDAAHFKRLSAFRARQDFLHRWFTVPISLWCRWLRDAD